METSETVVRLKPARLFHNIDDPLVTAAAEEESFVSFPDQKVLLVRKIIGTFSARQDVIGRGVIFFLSLHGKKQSSIKRNETAAGFYDRGMFGKRRIETDVFSRAVSDIIVRLESIFADEYRGLFVFGQKTFQRAAVIVVPVRYDDIVRR